MTRRLHVVGAGLAGLAAAVAAARAGWAVSLSEMAPMAGGRCRSWADATLDAVIDLGPHLLLGVNRSTLAFLNGIGGRVTTGPARFPFLDAATGRQWSVRPWRLGAGWAETWRALGVTGVPAHQTVADRLGACPSFATLWEPLCLSALNTPATQASAALFARLARALVMGGRSALTPIAFPEGLSAALVDPALAVLSRAGARIRFGRRLVGLGERALVFADGDDTLGPDDRAVLALGPVARSRLLGHPVPPMRAIATLHYRLGAPPALPGGQAQLGLVATDVHWLSVRGSVLSAVTSGLAENATTPDAGQTWSRIAPLLGLAPTPCPPSRAVVARRATLSHDPATTAARPGPRTDRPWLFLAGDDLASPWPCTMESAVSSGLTAARLALGRDGLGFS